MDSDWVSHRLYRHIHAVETTLEMAASAVQQASEVLFHSLTNAGKVVVWGVGNSSAIAEHAAMILNDQLEQSRPALPAIALGSSSALSAALHMRYNTMQMTARQIQAMGLPGDVLLILHTATGEEDFQLPMQEAYAREMTAIVMSNDAQSALASCLREVDVLIPLLSDQQAIALELQILFVHMLCERLDLMLLGQDD